MEGQSDRHIVVNGPYFAHAEIDTLILSKGDVYTSQPSSRATRSTEDIDFEEMPVYCVYLDVDAIKRAGIWTPAQIQEQLEKASEKEAKEFVAILRDLEKKTYLNFHDDNKRKIYATLRAQLPMMRPYSQKNFYFYF